MGLELLFEKTLELVWIEVASHHEPQAIGDEFPQVMVVPQLGIVLEQRTAILRVEVRLDRHQAFLADLPEHAVHELQQGDVVLTPVARTLDDGNGLREGGLDDLHGIAGEERSQRGAHDDEHFGRVPEREQLPALEHEATDDAQHHHYRADDLDHFAFTRVTGTFGGAEAHVPDIGQSLGALKSSVAARAHRIEGVAAAMGPPLPGSS